MRRIENTWAQTSKNKKVLLFIQLMQELLTDNSWDNYRVYALDTITRLQDLKYVALGIDEGEIREHYLKIVKDEVLWSLKTDPIVGLILQTKLDYYISALKSNSLSHKDCFLRANLIIDEIAKNYKDIAEKRIINLCFNNGDRDELRIVTSCYCSFLVSKGYNKQYIGRVIKEHFCTKDQYRATEKKLIKFFKNFDCKEKTYDFYIRLKKKEHAEFLTSALPFTNVPSDKIPKSCIKSDSTYFTLNSKQGLIKTTPSGLDPFAARDKVHLALCSIESMTKLEPVISKLQWDKTMFALPQRQRKGFRVFGTNNNLKELRVNLFYDVEQRFESLLVKTFSSTFLLESSRNRLFRSISTYHLALNSNSPDTQLVSLWASLESLLTEESKKSKIASYMPALVACISSSYIRKNFEAVYADLDRIYKEKFRNIVNKASQSGSNLNKFACIVLRNETTFQNLRSELIRLLISNPLASYRISNLNKKYSSTTNAYTVLARHSMRVEWQMNRIYRSRNEIVHAGRSPEYVNSIILNLDAYFRLIIDSLVSRLDTYNYAVSLDQLFSDVLVIFQHKHGYMKKQTFSEEEKINLLIDGKL